GRSPWVFRLILDDKTRMVVAALADDLWIAFNPANAAIERAWSGDIDYRGKVWDFSQDNPMTRGTTYLAASGTVLQAPSPASMTDAWTARDVIEFDGVWRFMATDATLTLPVVDLSGTRDVMLSFDEWSRGGSFRVDVSDDGGATWAAQTFDSTRHGHNDTEWQWNMKRIATNSARTRIRFVQTDAAHEKSLRNIRLRGSADRWTVDRHGTTSRVDIDWRGYDRIRDERVTFRFDLRLDGAVVARVEMTPERIADGLGRPALSQRIVLADVAPDTVVRLRLDTEPTGFLARTTLDGPAVLRTLDRARWIEFEGEDVTLTTTWTVIGD
ncbi:MAG: hypothetical protein KDA25_03070, partial [Phycisphaerales bacterium]|nr:hypothetical protein [Phycisphaerales bacterium]